MPFWFSMEHFYKVLSPFLFSANNMRQISYRLLSPSIELGHKKGTKLSSGYSKFMFFSGIQYSA